MKKQKIKFEKLVKAVQVLNNPDVKKIKGGIGADDVGLGITNTDITDL